MFDRRLSHVKLTFVPGQPVTAKAYFGYGHVWMRAQPAAEAVARPALRPPRPPSTTPWSRRRLALVGPAPRRVVA